ncbi:hypothetical protein [Pseudodesulfovibrio sp. zrk46]|uniref:hypothetical protein n=1 Tax=Pseudodesulfovibrio sp. zrk46 TaxID=2725288 RepID=UPI001448DBC8|nr:hypothetical protein [Pseudodesulfovibrio sp. zrk46]QJB57746.1 hypothetical protein HFN16_15625 [Pseudodesulfovibrio sp. zrk46]
MSTIMPQSELTRKAIAWISEMVERDSAINLEVLLEEASVRYNLSPKEMEFLLRFYEEKKVAQKLEITT